MNSYFTFENKTISAPMPITFIYDIRFFFKARMLLEGNGCLSQKTIPENLEHRAHKNAAKPSAMAASLGTPESGSVRSRIASLVPRPLMEIGITFTIPISALSP